MQFPGKYCKIKHRINLRRAIMKKILTLSLVLLLLFSGVCFAEKSKLKKNTWTLYHEGDKQVGLWFVTFIPNQKGAAHSYFYEAVVLDYAKNQYRIIRAYQADKKNKKVKTSDQRFVDAEWKSIAGTKYPPRLHQLIIQ